MKTNFSTITKILATRFHKAMMTGDQVALYDRMGETMASDSTKNEVTLTVPADADMADLVVAKRQFELESFAGWQVRFIEQDDAPAAPAQPQGPSQPQPDR